MVSVRPAGRASKPSSTFRPVPVDVDLGERLLDEDLSDEDLSQRLQEGPPDDD
ncbi:hypothetical protein [Haloarcula sp. JP-L23]|uniref:hypothetical protein n=1 Tax=Haloarcula sp. JP-L23 TaxID=2716717 RepID=UPI00140F232B|nr:hypothetical protein G9465_24245 [Haloarcula sp. JP-L23]